MPDATTYVQKKQTTILCKMKDQAIGLEIVEMAKAPNSPHPLIRAEGGVLLRFFCSTQPEATWVRMCLGPWEASELAAKIQGRCTPRTRWSSRSPRTSSSVGPRTTSRVRRSSPPGPSSAGFANKTKREPSTLPRAYLCDADLPLVQAAAAPDIARLTRHLAGGGNVGWPSAGIGTGRADLARRAPAIARWYASVLDALKRIAALTKSPLGT